MQWPQFTLLVSWYSFINSLYIFFASIDSFLEVRLMLTLTPVVCVLSGIAFSSIFDKYTAEDGERKPSDKESKEALGCLNPMKFEWIVFSDRRLYDKATKNKQSRGTASINPVVQSASDSSADQIGMNTRSIVLVAMLFILLMYVAHCTYVTSNAYSHPSVVLQSHSSDGYEFMNDWHQIIITWISHFAWKIFQITEYYIIFCIYLLNFEGIES